MAINKAYSQYKENSVLTSSPEELTLMLYEGLVKFILQAGKAIEDKDVQKANDSILRAQDIITEFQVTLNMKYPVSKGLMMMYDYMKRRLIEANIKKDKDILDEVLSFAKELRDTWAEAMKIAKHQNQAKMSAKQG